MNKQPKQSEKPTQQIELPLSPGALGWLLTQYAPDQYGGDPAKYEWKLVGTKKQ